MIFLPSILRRYSALSPTECLIVVLGADDTPATFVAVNVDLWASRVVACLWVNLAILSGAIRARALASVRPCYKNKEHAA